jgi:hypothetical protein
MFKQKNNMMTSLDQRPVDQIRAEFLSQVLAGLALWRGLCHASGGCFLVGRLFD